MKSYSWTSWTDLSLFLWADHPTSVWQWQHLHPKVLDIREQTLHSCFLEDVQNVASTCLQTGYLAVSSVPHSIINGCKQVLALSVKTEYTFPLAEKVRSFLDNPSAFMADIPVAACHYHYCCCCCCSIRQGWSQESEELDEDIGFGLQLIHSEQPTWPAQF